MREDLLPLLALDCDAAARHVRYLRAADLEGIPAWILARTAARMRAASYSAVTAARMLEKRAADLEKAEGQ